MLGVFGGFPSRIRRLQHFFAISVIFKLYSLFTAGIPMKDIYIADLANFDEGKLFDGYFIVLAKQQRTTKNNKPYLSLILGDKTGQLEGRVWEPGDPRIAKDFDRGDVVKARGSASPPDDRPQMKIDQIRVALPNEVDKSGLLPSATCDVADLWRLLL